MKDALQLLRSFCDLYFHQKDVEGALELFTDDIHWVGVFNKEDVRDKNTARAFMTEDMAHLRASFRCELSEGSCAPVAPGASVACARMTLTTDERQYLCRVTCVSRPAGDDARLCAMHISLPDDRIIAGEYIPMSIEREREIDIRERLLDEVISGGLMFCYVTDTFPVFFVNRNLWRNLKYPSEQAYIAALDGKGVNGIHPDDREETVREILRQLLRYDGYTVEYRMRRFGGDYVCVRDVGKRIVADNGMDAISSLIYDISDMRDRQAQMDNLLSAIPGGVAKFRVRGDKAFLLYQSDGLSALTGRTAAQSANYLSRGADRVLYAEDAPRVWATIQRVVAEGGPCALSYRLLHQNGDYVWVTASFQRTGEEDGDPVLHAVFTHMAEMNHLYHMLTETSDTAVIARDAESYELIYANRKARAMLGGVPEDRYIGRKCYALFNRYDAPCPFCPAVAYEKGRMTETEVRVPGTNRRFSVKGTRMDWAGRDAVLAYIDESPRDAAEPDAMRELVDRVACGFGVCSVDQERNFQIEYINDEYFAACGEKRDFLLSMYRKDLYYGIHPDDRAMVKEKIEDLRVNLRGHEMTYRYVSSVGKTIWLSVKTRVVNHPDGTLTSYSTYYDVTAQLEPHQQLRDLIQTMPCGICMYRWDGVNLSPIIVNRQYDEMLGRDAIAYLRQVERLRFTHIHPDDLEDLRRASFEALAVTHSIDHVHRVLNARTGAYRWVHMRGKSVPQGDGTQLAYVCYTDMAGEMGEN